MASIQEVVNAAHRIGESADEVQRRTLICADALKGHSSRLAMAVKGSRSGMDAVRQVGVAERSVRDSAARLLTLQSTIDRFIQDLTK